MCVIAFSPKGVDIPSVEQIKQMWKTNPDGAGYAFVGKKGEVFYRKGFMELDDLLKELEKPEKFKNTNFAIHFRIGTSGENDSKTCHPFPISTNFGELRQTSGKAESVLFHNGVIGEGGLVSPLSSDTQDFVIAMCPMLKKYNRSKTRDKLIEQIVEGNRVLCLYKNNAFKMYGKWQKDGDLWVSNLNYKWSSYSSYDWYGDYGYYSDYYYDHYHYSPQTKSDKSWEETLSTTKINQYGERVPTDDKDEKTDTKSKTEADKIFADLINNQYAFMTSDEFEKLKEYADGYTKDEIEYAGFLFEYDREQELIWLEEDMYDYLDRKENKDEQQ